LATTPSGSRASPGGEPPDDADKVQPTVRDALIGLGIGLVLLFLGMRVPSRILSWLLIGIGLLFVVVMAGFVIVSVWERASPGIRRVTARARGHVRRDPQLGTLIRDVKGECWEGTFAAGDRRIELLIDGRDEPDPKLVSRARELVADFGTVQQRLDAYLAEEATREDDAEMAAQIAALQVSAVKFLSRKARARVEIDFRGPDEDVFWSCSYVDGKPKGLWFD
jgi:hypothetical protein